MRKSTARTAGVHNATATRKPCRARKGIPTRSAPRKSMSWAIGLKTGGLAWTLRLDRGQLVFTSDEKRPRTIRLVHDQKARKLHLEGPASIVKEFAYVFWWHIAEQIMRDAEKQSPREKETTIRAARSINRYMQHLQQQLPRAARSIPLGN